MENQIKEMEEIIKKNLPAQVGEVLSKELERLYKVETEHNYYKDIVSKNDVEIKELRSKLEEHRVLDAKLKTIEEAQEKLNNETRDLKVKILEYQLEAEKDKTDFTKNVALGLVRNTEFKKSIFDNEIQQPYTDSNGVYHYPTPISKSLIETKKAE